MGAIFTRMLLGIISDVLLEIFMSQLGEKVKYIHDVLLARGLLSGRRRLIRLRVDRN